MRWDTGTSCLCVVPELTGFRDGSQIVYRPQKGEEEEQTAKLSLECKKRNFLHENKFLCIFYPSFTKSFNKPMTLFLASPDSLVIYALNPKYSPNKKLPRFRNKSTKLSLEPVNPCFFLLNGVSSVESVQFDSNSFGINKSFIMFMLE